MVCNNEYCNSLECVCDPCTCREGTQECLCECCVSEASLTCERRFKVRINKLEKEK